MKRWYVVQVYPGYEERVKVDLMLRGKEQGLEALFGEILVPSARLRGFFETEEERNQQLFPGYVLVEMETAQESIRLVQSCPRVSRFLGGREPSALSPKEVERIMSQMRGEVAVAARQSEFTVGNEVEIRDGPFAGFVGIVDKIDDEAEKLTVMVSIFGRMTPVELGFDHIKR